jgi:hypothetical protein
MPDINEFIVIVTALATGLGLPKLWELIAKSSSLQGQKKQTEIQQLRNEVADLRAENQKLITLVVKAVYLVRDAVDDKQSKQTVLDKADKIIELLTKQQN